MIEERERIFTAHAQLLFTGHLVRLSPSMGRERARTAGRGVECIRLADEYSVRICTSNANNRAALATGNLAMISPEHDLVRVQLYEGAALPAIDVHDLPAAPVPALHTCSDR